jgi:hypothetical protein
MSIPPELSAIIDEDLATIRAELRRLAPRTRLVLAGSLAFDEPWARRQAGGGWVLESDYDLYLVVPGLRQSLAIASSDALRELGPRLGTRAAVDPYVIWQPLLDRGLVGMVGRWLDDGTFVDCPLDPHALRVNQARKALLRQRLLAPRETPERARYQRTKAAIEALRAVILGHAPDISPRALFSLRANLRWLRSGAGTLDAEHRTTLESLLVARLDLSPTPPEPAPPAAIDAWLDGFASHHIEGLADGQRRGGGPSTTTLRAWLSWLHHGLLPSPRVDYDTALLALLADPACASLAGNPEAQRAFETRWRHLSLAPWLPRPPGALIRAVDGALGNPMNAKGERYLDPRGGT